MYTGKYGTAGVFIKDLPSDFNHSKKTVFLLKKEINERDYYYKLTPNKRSVTQFSHNGEVIELMNLKLTKKRLYEDSYNALFEKDVNIVLVDELDYSRYRDVYNGDTWLSHSKTNEDVKFKDLINSNYPNYENLEDLKEAYKELVVVGFEKKFERNFNFKIFIKEIIENHKNKKLTFISTVPNYKWKEWLFSRISEEEIYEVEDDKIIQDFIKRVNYVHIDNPYFVLDWTEIDYDTGFIGEILKFMHDFRYDNSSEFLLLDEVDDLPESLIEILDKYDMDIEDLYEGTVSVPNCYLELKMISDTYHIMGGNHHYGNGLIDAIMIILDSFGKKGKTGILFG